MKKRSGPKSPRETLFDNGQNKRILERRLESKKYVGIRSKFTETNEGHNFNGYREVMQDKGQRN